MQERYEQLRLQYDTYTYSELSKRADELCRELYKKDFIEIYKDEVFDGEELINAILSMQKIIDMKERNKKVIEQREVLNKPVMNTQSTLPITLDSKVTFIDLWREKWNKRIVHQDVPRDLYCLVFIAQHFRHITIYKGVEEDIRVHACVIMPSGTGKSDGNDFLSSVCELTGLTTHYLDRYTDAILTGSIDQKKVENNMKRNYKAGDVGYQDPHQKSVLESYHIVIYDEGENILKTTTNTEGAQRHLQKAMNRYGSAANKITNSLVGNSVECYPSCSIVITSYYLVQFKDTLLNRGLLQRMIVYIKPEDEGQRSDIINCIVDSVPTFTNDVSEAEGKKKSREASDEELNIKLIAELQSLQEFHKNTTSIYIREEVNVIIKEIISQLREMMPMNSSQRDTWESMISRLTLHILKLSAIFAIMRYRTYIDEQDVRSAAALLVETMESVGIFLKDNSRNVTFDRNIPYYNILKRSQHAGVLMDESDLLDYMEKEMHLTRSRASDVLHSMSSANKLKVAIVDGKKKVKIGA